MENNQTRYTIDGVELNPEYGPWWVPATRFDKLSVQLDAAEAVLGQAREWLGRYNDEDNPLDATYLEDLALILAAVPTQKGEEK